MSFFQYSQAKNHLGSWIFSGGEVVYAWLTGWCRPGDTEAYEVHIRQPPFAFGELWVAGAPPVFFEGSGGAAQIHYGAVPVAPTGYVLFTGFGTAGVDNGAVVRVLGICVGAVEVVDPFTDITQHIIQTAGVG